MNPAHHKLYTLVNDKCNERLAGNPLIWDAEQAVIKAAMAWSQAGAMNGANPAGLLEAISRLAALTESGTPHP